MVRRKSEKRVYTRNDGRKVEFFGHFEHAVGCHLDKLLDQGKILRWEYEPKTFCFTYRKKERRYTPDFFVKIDDETSTWLEVKGYINLEEIQKAKRFRAVYPLFNYIIVGEDLFSLITSKGNYIGCEVREERFAELLSMAVSDLSCKKFCNIAFYDNSY